MVTIAGKGMVAAVSDRFQKLARIPNRGESSSQVVGGLFYLLKQAALVGGLLEALWLRREIASGVRLLTA